MTTYFDREQSIEYRLGSETGPVLQTIANRFCADNPAVPVQYSLRSTQGFSITKDYLDEILLHEKFPQMEREQYVYARAGLTPQAPGPVHFRFGAYGPVTIYVNGKKSFQTNHTQERFSETLSDICLDLKEGVNDLLFECVSTPLGCGFRIGSSSYKGRRIQFFAVDEAHKGMNGFVYTEPQKTAMDPADADSVCWLPRAVWTEEEKQESVCSRLFDGKTMLSVTRVFVPQEGMIRILGACGRTGQEPVEVFADGKRAGTSKDDSLTLELSLASGYHTLAFLGGDPDVTVEDRQRTVLELEAPVLCMGQPQTWIYAGPFDRVRPSEEEISRMLSFKKPFETDLGKEFWRVDGPDLYLRPVNEGTLYGEWNYPLGVTLYGMIQTARYEHDNALECYVRGHMEKCTGFYEYCMWDKEHYGAAPFHNQLTTIDSLDDCGSFASALLEVMKDYEIPEGDVISAMVAEYMKDRQQRMEDGTFYRNHSYLPVMNETIWADDLYMSVPFLCRYYKRSGDECWLKEAAGQLKRIFGYLYMPEEGVLSHIYDTHYGVQTKVPWGRGNGWALFSAAELLSVMPKEHENREEILDIYRTLCRGYLKVQDPDGMWHQVLTMKESYEETSCTAMFIYGFAKGVKNGWHTDGEAYRKAAIKGWRALCRTSIDWKGNIYGVCRGSGYSFSREYYAYELGWNFNDTHGTGIVLLAGIETERMLCPEE